MSNVAGVGVAVEYGPDSRCALAPNQHRWKVIPFLGVYVHAIGGGPRVRAARRDSIGEGDPERTGGVEEGVADEE